MSALDFLFEGRPPPATTTYGTTSTEMPSWLSDYTQGLITRANSIAGEPYQAYGGPRLAGLNEDQQRSFDITRGASGLYTPWITGAQQSAQGALGQAMPYLNKAAQTYPQVAKQYMDPYQENVINRAGTLANRQLQEKFLPSVEATFGAAGSGPRSTQMRRTVDNGVRDLTEGLHEQALGALSTGYTTGANIFGQDMQRQGALGDTVGNLALNSGQVSGNLAGTAQNLALRDAASQAAVGEQLQGDQQRSLDLAHSDFAEQRDYPKSQADWLSSIIRGMPYDQTTNRNEVGPANVYQPSGAAQLGSLVTTGLGIYNDIKGTGAGGGGGTAPATTDPRDWLARGGKIRYRGYKKGGRVVKGALCYA